MSEAGKERRKSARDRILDAAEELFHAHGYHATSTDMIQTAANVSKSTLYRHFPAKETLFEASMEEGGRRFIDLVGPLSTVDDLTDFLTKIGLELLRALLTPYALDQFRLMVMESQRFPALGQGYYNAGPKGVVDIVERYLDGAVARGEIRIADTRVAAEQFVSLIRGEIHIKALLGVRTTLSPRATKRHVDETVAGFLAMCGFRAG